MRDWEYKEKSDSIIAGNVLLISGLCGFLLGAYLNGTWQLAAESVQVISGIVQYPAENPFYWYHTKAWTLLHQMFVPFALAGLSEKTISFLMSGLIGMIAFQALALSVWSISKDAVLAIGAPFLVLFTYATRYFSIYPIFLMSTTNTHGAIGMSLFLLTIGMISSEKKKAGLFLLGLFPAVHLSIAALCWIVVIINFCFSSAEFQTSLRKDAKYFFIGLTITATSLLIHYLWIYDVPQIENTLTRKYFDAFLAFWDNHRRPLDWNKPGVYLNAAAFVTSMVWTTLHRKHLNNGAAFLLRSFSIASILGLFFAILSHVPTRDLPEFFLRLMPLRILEFNNLAFVTLFVGLCGLFGKNFSSRLLLLCFFSVAVLEKHVAIILMLAFGLALSFLPLLTDDRIRYFSKRPLVARALRWSMMACLLFVAISTTAHSDQFHADSVDWQKYALKDRSNDRIFYAISHRQGLLLTGADLHLIQLRTRRPVLLDGGQLDMLPYAVETGPQMEMIVREVYGVSFFSPPVEAFRTASIPKQPVKKVWESRSEKSWKMIREKYGVTEVLTYSDWSLQLPVLGNSKNFISYAIPN